MRTSPDVCDTLIENSFRQYLHMMSILENMKTEEEEKKRKKEEKEKGRIDSSSCNVRFCCCVFVT